MQTMETDTSNYSKDFNNDSSDLESVTNTNTTHGVSMREEDLVYLPRNNVGMSQSAGHMTEVQTLMAPSSRELVPSHELKMIGEVTEVSEVETHMEPPESSSELVPIQEEFKMLQEVTEVETRMAAQSSSRELVPTAGETRMASQYSSRELIPSQEELKLLRDAVVQLDAALERQRVVLKNQRREIASLKKERDLLRADLKASRVLPRSTWQDDPLVSQCVGKMGNWSRQFSATLKCE